MNQAWLIQRGAIPCKRVLTINQVDFGHEKLLPWPERNPKEQKTTEPRDGCEGSSHPFCEWLLHGMPPLVTSECQSRNARFERCCLQFTDVNLPQTSGCYLRCCSPQELDDTIWEADVASSFDSQPTLVHRET